MTNVVNLYDRRVLKELDDLEGVIKATQVLIDHIEDDDERQHHEDSLQQVRLNMEKKRREIRERNQIPEGAAGER